MENRSSSPQPPPAPFAGAAAIRTASPAEPSPRPVSGRMIYIDNLRWVMIMLVVSMHAAVTYSHLGSWYYNENRPVSAPELGIFATYQAFLQSFFMGFLFFIAGFFVPPAYDKKGPSRFLKDRAFRLGIPLLFFVFLLQPLSIYCISLFHGDSQDGNLVEIYKWYLQRTRWPGGTGPLWFCEALLLFCLAYALAKKWQNSARPPRRPALPNKTSVWGLILLLALASFFVRLSWPVGTNFTNLQFCYFSQYILYFIAGTLAYRGDWLQKFPDAWKKYWAVVGLAGGLLIWLMILAFGGAFKGQLPLYWGGWHWQSIAMTGWEAIAGTGISLFLLIWFRQRFNKQGRIASFFSANAFAVYVFHTPIMITISRWMAPLEFPLLVKFLMLTILSIVVTYLLAAFVFRKLPLLRRIL